MRDEVVEKVQEEHEQKFASNLPTSKFHSTGRQRNGYASAISALCVRDLNPGEDFLSGRNAIRKDQLQVRFGRVQVREPIVKVSRFRSGGPNCSFQATV